MKLVILLALAAVAVAAPAQNDVVILRYDNDNSGLDSYKFAYELSDGSKRDEAGQLKNVGTDNESIAVQGSYSWVGPDGVTYTVTYLADENGFQPQIQQGPGGGIAPAVLSAFSG